MPYSTTVQNCLSARRLGPTYAPPEPLEDLHILDLLELTGSQPKAGQALAMHQSTVCRSVQKLTEQFRLQPRPGARVCRYGTNESLLLLRQSYRAHRLMDGLLRIATDGFHQPLLAGMASVQTVPPRCRLSHDWAQLLEQALIDGAIVSSWCHPRLLPPQQPPCWQGLTTVPLGELPMQLVTTATETGEELPPRKVLLPRKSITPLLHQTVAWHGFQVEQQPMACQEVSAWIKRLRDRDLVMPICEGLLEQGWIEANGLMLHPQQPDLREQLWLLLPSGPLPKSREARHLIRTLRQRVEKAGEASQAGPAEDSSENYAASALLRRHEHGERTASAAVPL